MNIEDKNNQNKMVRKLNESEKNLDFQNVCITDADIISDYKFYMADKILKNLLNKELITTDEYIAIRRKNKGKFRPYLSDIMP